jgi:hypothetical protein
MDRKETECGLNSSGSGQGPVVCFCEHGNELSCSVHNREFLGDLIC